MSPTAALVALGALALGVLVGLRWRGRAQTPGTGLTRVDAHLAGPPTGTAPPSPMRRDMQVSAERTEAREDLELLDSLLQDIRDVAGADEAILWRWIEARQTLAPAAWSSYAARPEHFDAPRWAPHVRWTAEQGSVHVARGNSNEGDVVFASAPVISSSGLVGVISVTRDGPDGLHTANGSVADWMPRFAAQLAMVGELLDLRREYGRHIRQTGALIEAVRQLQEHTSAEAFAHAVCLTAMDVTSANDAVLVRWFAAESRGVVQAASPGVTVAAGATIAADSLVAQACTDARPLALADARSQTSAVSPFGATHPIRIVGSLAIVPIQRGREVIGAIVVEGKATQQIGQYESQSLALLAAVIRGSLEIAWEIEEVSMRARTDALTGLSNRREFDEQLARVVAETDRFGGSSSLIVADLDHFKKVNDTYGHDAGDAVLKHVAQILRDGVRTIDICARYGGEELAILLPQTPGKGALELAERLRQRIEGSPVTSNGTVIPVTASFGVATYPEPVPYGDWLFPAADKALYSAKEEGRNRVKVITPKDVTTKLYKRTI
jgi:diguanylate cyclase (GGDEF)-like protein